MHGQGKDPFTIVAREVPGWFYADGKMEPSRPQFEIVLEIRDSSLIRRTVRNLNTDNLVTDETEYRLLTELVSYDRAALTYKVLTDETRRFAPVVRAIGKPGADAVEIIFIGPDWMQSVKTVRNYMVIQRYRRSQ